MKINELKSVSQWRPVYNTLFNRGWNEAADIAEYLEDNGFYELGRGFFSSVFGKDDLNFAIKLVEDDPNYIKYIKYYAKKGRHNPHLPRIYKHKRVGTVDVVVTEKLYPLSNMDHDIFDMIIKFKNYIEHPNNFDEYYIKHNVNHFIDEYSQLAHAIIDLYKIFGSKYIDISINNLMCRDDGTIVITDPVHSL